MKSRRRGKIINICSLASEIGRPEHRALCGQQGRRADADAGAGGGAGAVQIQVNGIAPGFFATEMNAALTANAEFSRVGATAHAGRALGRARPRSPARRCSSPPAPRLRHRSRAVRRRRRSASRIETCVPRLSRPPRSGIIEAIKAGTARGCTRSVPASHVRARNARRCPPATIRPPPRRPPSDAHDALSLHPPPLTRAELLRPGTPAILALADGTRVSRPRDRRARPRRRRGGVQHVDDGLPGNPDRPVVRRADRHADLSACRQRGRQSGGRRIARAVRGGPRHPRPAAAVSNWRATRRPRRPTSRRNGIVGICRHRHAQADPHAARRTARRTAASSPRRRSSEADAEARRSRAPAPRRRWRDSISPRS